MSTLSTLLKPLLEVTHDRLVHTDGQERLEYWSAFQKLWEIYPENDVPYGDLHNRHMVGNILFLVTRAVERATGNAVPALEGSFPDCPFDAWSSDEWKMFAEYLKAAAISLMRMDATVDPGEIEDAKPDPERCLSPLLNAKVDKIIRYIKVYKMAAPIRAQLMMQLEDKTKKDDELPQIPIKKVAEVWSFCTEEEDNVVQDQFLRKIFCKGDDDEAPRLRTIGELREAFSEKPFNFDRFHDRIDVLMGEWCTEFFNEPRLAPFYFPDNLVEAHNQNPIEILNNLRKRRHNLRNTGEDPLQDSLRLAESLAAQSPAARDPPDARRASSLYRRKHSATQLKFDDEEYVEPTIRKGDGTHQLSSLPVRGGLEVEEDSQGDEDTPRRTKKRKSQQKKYEGKRSWSVEEKSAIIEGIRTHGKGNWADIKQEYDVLFSMRTSGQIKDCFRRMLAKGEIPKDLCAEYQEEEKANSLVK